MNSILRPPTFSLGQGLRRLGVLALAGLLGACSSSGGSGTGPGGSPAPSNPAEFLSQLDAVQGEIPTSDMPVTGSAAYSGAVLLDITAGSETLQALGDLSFAVDFGPVDGSGVAANPVRDAQVANLAGESSQGAAFDWQGLTLTQAAADAAGFASVVGVNAFTVTAPVVGEITTRTGALSIAVLGEVDSSTAPELGGEGTMLVTLTGSFFGTGGAATAGMAQAIFDDTSGAGIFNATGVGSYYAEN